MMPNRSADILFQLVQSLTKAEKRNFKLYVTRNTGNTDLKIIELFDAIDKLEDYEEAILLKKLSSIKKPQLANAKAHLYKQLLASLRLIKSSESIDLELHEQLDYAKILYNKGLYHQSLKLLERVKELAETYFQDSFLIQAISLEKKIETLHITRSLQNRAQELSMESIKVHKKRLNITKLSNLALELYSWYIKNGHARNIADEKEIAAYFNERFTSEMRSSTGFYEQLYIHQCYVWYYFIKQDFLNYYRHTQKWVDLFLQNPIMVEVETGHYIKGLHNLLNAHYDLRNYREFAKTLELFEDFATSNLAKLQNNNNVQCFVYTISARLNYYLITGNFDKALEVLPEMEEKLKENSLFLDRHRVLVLNYKFATIHFGAGNFDKAIDYLNYIINDNVDLRNDLQCYARVLHWLAHYELGNFELLESLTRSVSRFMEKMENLTVVEEEMFRFLKKTFYKNPAKQVDDFNDFLNSLKLYERNRFATRSFAYLDIISWVESKINQKPMKTVIHDKYLASKHR